MFHLKSEKPSSLPLLMSKRSPFLMKFVLILIVIISICYLENTIVAHQGYIPHSTAEGQQSEAHIKAVEKASMLNGHYLSRIIYKAGDPNSAHLAAPVGEGSEYDTSNYTAAIVMGRLREEQDKIQWVNRLKNIQSQYIYIVDDPTTDTPHLEKNHGREVAVYLDYIIKHYNNLTDITFFWHNEDVVWHNNILLGWSSLETINRMDRQNIIRSGYVPSRCDQWPGCPTWIRFNPSKAEHALDPHRLEDMYNPTLLKRLFTDTENFPPFFAGTCCSQFAVSRKTIHSRSLETYENMRDWIIEMDDDQRAGMVFEYLWPYIFLRRGTLCPSMQDCYCKTYNFCIDDHEAIENLERWNNLRTRREELRYQVIFMEEARNAKEKDVKSHGGSLKDALAIEETFEREIERLYDELESLEERTWNTREDVIKFWRLPVPPVGW